MKILMVADYTYRIHSGNATLHKGKIYEAYSYRDSHYKVKVEDREEDVLVPEKIVREVEDIKLPLKVGDKVIKKSGNSFTSGARIAEVTELEWSEIHNRFKVFTNETQGFLFHTELGIAKTGEQPKVQTGTIQTEKVSAGESGTNAPIKQFVDVTELQLFAPVVDGVGPDAPIVYNEQGGGQSDSPYRLDLVDPKALLDISKVLKEGADKYGENNWKKISINDHLNHLLVHVYAYLAGDESDKHLAHAACRAIFALGVELEEKK